MQQIAKLIKPRFTYSLQKKNNTEQAVCCYKKNHIWFNNRYIQNNTIYCLIYKRYVYYIVMMYSAYCNYDTVQNTFWPRKRSVDVMNLCLKNPFWRSESRKNIERITGGHWHWIAYSCRQDEICCTAYDDSVNFLPQTLASPLSLFIVL